MNGRPFTEEDIQYIKDQRAKGVKLSVIADALGRSKASLSGCIHRINMTPEQRLARDERAREYRKQYYAKHWGAEREYQKQYYATHPNDHQRRQRKPKTPEQRKPKTPEQRASWNAYLRRYRAAHPERVKAWREAQTLRAAERILQAREAAAAAELEEARRLIREG